MEPNQTLTCADIRLGAEASNHPKTQASNPLVYSTKNQLKYL